MRQRQRQRKATVAVAAGASADGVHGCTANFHSKAGGGGGGGLRLTWSHPFVCIIQGMASGKLQSRAGPTTMIYAQHSLSAWKIAVSAADTLPARQGSLAPRRGCRFASSPFFRSSRKLKVFGAQRNCVASFRRRRWRRRKEEGEAK